MCLLAPACLVRLSIGRSIDRRRRRRRVRLGSPLSPASRASAGGPHLQKLCQTRPRFAAAGWTSQYRGGRRGRAPRFGSAARGAAAVTRHEPGAAGGNSPPVVRRGRVVGRYRARGERRCPARVPARARISAAQTPTDTRPDRSRAASSCRARSCAEQRALRLPWRCCLRPGRARRRSASARTRRPVRRDGAAVAIASGCSSPSTQRSAKLRSSRTLPGHGLSFHSAIWAAVQRGIGRLSRNDAISVKWVSSSATSSARSRSGGNAIVATLSR
jgi:hypothetical protein